MNNIIQIPVLITLLLKHKGWKKKSLKEGWEKEKGTWNFWERRKKEKKLKQRNEKIGVWKNGSAIKKDENGEWRWLRWDFKEHQKVKKNHL